MSPVLYTKFGYTPCIIVGTVIVAIALLVIAKVLTPGFANKEKTDYTFSVSLCSMSVGYLFAVTVDSNKELII